MIVEIDVIKNYPPCRLNRGENGEMKVAKFSGCDRAMISSQCQKRWLRTNELFRSDVGEENLGIRTRGMPGYIGEKLAAAGVPSDVVDVAVARLASVATKKEKREKAEKGFTAQMIMYAQDDLRCLTDTVSALAAGCTTRAQAESALTADAISAALNATSGQRFVGVDIALFGRFVTMAGLPDVKSAMQVAPALSIHPVVRGLDFYTAQDDLLTGRTDGAGTAGMMGLTSFNSSCMYMYTVVDIDRLRDNLHGADDPDGLIRITIPALIRTMALTNPTGGQAGMAAHVPASFIQVRISKSKIPVSQILAFADPVRPANGPVESQGIRALAEYAVTCKAQTGLEPDTRLWFVPGQSIRPDVPHTPCVALPDLLTAVRDRLK